MFKNEPQTYRDNYSGAYKTLEKKFDTSYELKEYNEHEAMKLCSMRRTVYPFQLISWNMTIIVKVIMQGKLIEVACALRTY